MFSSNKNVNFPTSNYRLESYPSIKELVEIIEHVKHEHGVKHCYQWEKKKEYKTFTMSMLYYHDQDDLEWQLHEQNLVGTKMVWFHKTKDIAVIYPHILQAVGAKHAMGEDPPPKDEDEDKPAMSLSEKLKQRKDKSATIEIKDPAEDSIPAPQPSASRLLQGNLRGRPITWLLNTAQQAEITGQMKIDGKLYSVYIQFGLGRPVHAYSPNRVGLEAILELFTWLEGEVSFEEGIQPESASIQDSSDEILKAGSQMLEDLEWLKQVHVYETSALRTEPGVEMSEEQFDQRLRKGPDFGLKVQMNFYRNINGTRSIREIGDKLSLGYSRTLAIAINFLKLGLALTPDGRSLRQVTVSDGEPETTMIPWSGANQQPPKEEAAPAPKPPMFLFGLGLADGDSNSTSSNSSSSNAYSSSNSTSTPSGGYSSGAAYSSPAASPANPIYIPEPEPDLPPPIVRRTGAHEQMNTGSQPSIFNTGAQQQLRNTGPQPSLSQTGGHAARKTTESDVSPAVAAMMGANDTKKTQDLGQQLRAIQGTQRPKEVPIETELEENPNVFKIGVPSVLTKLGDGQSQELAKLINDERTGILTFAALQYLLEREYARAFRFGTEFSLIVFSIKLGAEAERTSMPLTALTMIINTIDMIKRDVDVLGHFGDTTFGIMLPHVNSTQSCSFVDRMITDLPKVAPKLAGYRPVLYCGIATVPHDARDLNALVESAQQAMLEAAKTNVIRVRSCDLPK